MKSNSWSKEKPTEPGTYLFYGDYVSLDRRNVLRPRFHVCEVSKMRNGLAYVAGGQFLHDGHFYGVFRPMVETPPDLASFGFDLGDSDD